VKSILVGTCGGNLREVFCPTIGKSPGDKLTPEDRQRLFEFVEKTGSDGLLLREGEEERTVVEDGVPKRIPKVPETRAVIYNGLLCFRSPKAEAKSVHITPLISVRNKPTCTRPSKFLQVFNSNLSL